MKKKDLLKEQFNEFKLSAPQAKVVFGGGAIATTTGETFSGSPSAGDDCDSDNDSIPSGGPLPARKA